MVATVIKQLKSLSLAHKLTSRKAGKCCRLHGHNYQITVFYEDEVDEETGMVLNFSEFDLLEEFISWLFDHRAVKKATRHTKDYLAFPFEPTAEMLAATIAYSAFLTLKPSAHGAIMVQVSETDRCAARYRLALGGLPEKLEDWIVDMLSRFRVGGVAHE